MEINIHNVTDVRIDTVRQSASGCNYMTLVVVDRDGKKTEVCLYSETSTPINLRIGGE